MWPLALDAVRNYSMLGIILAALLVRLPGLGSSLWIDEIVTLVYSVRLPWDQIFTTYPGPNHHALYAILAKLCVTVFGESEIALRLPAVLFGVLAVAATAAFARAVVSPADGIAAGLLLAFSYHAVWFSQNARGYSGLMFCLMAASWLFYLGIKGQPRVWAWYAVVVALGMWVQLNMIVAPATHATILVLDAVTGGRLWPRLDASARRAAWLGLFGAGILTLLAYAPIVPRLVFVFGRSIQPGDTGNVNPLLFARDLVEGLTASLPLTIVALSILVVGLLGVLDYARHNRLALAMLLLPGVWGFLVAGMVGSGIAPRFFIYLLPIALVLGVRAILVIAGRWRGLAIVVLVGLSAASLLFVYRYPKQDFTGALAYARQHAGPDATISAAGLAATAYRIHYAPDIIPVYTDEEYTGMLRSSRETWMLLTLSRHMRIHNSTIYDRIEADLELKATFPGTLGDGNVYVYYGRR